MKKRELEFFRKILKQQLRELTQKSDAAIAGLLDATVTSADPLDRTSLELERDFTLRIMDRENKSMSKKRSTMLAVRRHPDVCIDHRGLGWV